MKLERLRTLDLQNPLGIDEVPYFSWVLKSDEKDVMQAAYRIRVEDEKGECQWDSDWMTSVKSTFVKYEGSKLQSRTAYRWQVDVKDNHNNCASAEASFETAMLDSTEWQAKWVRSQLPVSERTLGFGNQAPATMFRTAFQTTDQKIRAARLYASAQGIYQVYVNGERLNDRELAPGYSSYDQLLAYQTYDLTKYIHNGDNALGMYVADGWYYSRTTAIHAAETAAEPHAVIYELHIQYEDGTEQVMGSDENVKTAYGAVKSADMFAGELYDANAEVCGWAEVDFDDTNWTPVKTENLGMDQLIADGDEPVVAVAEFPAKDVFVAPNGDTIVDFGQNMAGRVRMHIDLAKGYKVALEHFEVLGKDGNFFNSIISGGGVGDGVDQRVEFISNGKEVNYEPAFTFLGFRYVRVTVLDPDGNVVSECPLRASDLTAVALSTKKDNTGTFSCSDERLNQLYSNIRWSQYSNMISIPTDCPQREKAGWTGDAGIYIKTAMLNEDVSAFFRKWMKSVVADQQVNGAIPMVVPFNETYRNMSAMMGQMMGQTEPIGPAGWGDAVILVPWKIYQVSGNKEILLQSYDAMKKWCEYIICSAEKCGRPDLPREKEKYLWNTGFHYGEWVIPSTAKAGFDDPEAIGRAMMTTAQYIAPIYGYYSMALFTKIANLLGNTDDETHYGVIAANMKEAIMTCLVGPNGEAPAEFMGAYVLMLAFDLVPKQHKKNFVAHLVQMIVDNDGCLDTGFLATPFLLDVLVENGYETLAYDVLLQTKNPSWLYEVEHGATTIWETWGAVSEDGEPRHVSMNHYSFGCVASWMFENINGIKFDQPGFEHFVIHPRIDERITWAKRTYDSAYGTIACDWSYKNAAEWCMNVEIPCNTTATVILPDGDTKELGSGSYRFANK